MPFDLGITRDGLHELRARLAEAPAVRSTPREVLRQYSDLVDNLVRKAFQQAQAQAPAPSSVCLMAVGGYGRSELAPFSDVDLLLLYPSSNKANLPPLIEKTLYPLWDLGLELSCSSRSISECLAMARSDLEVKTALIDGRYLDGEFEIFRQWHDRFSKRVLYRRIVKFADALTRELGLRHRKYADAAFVLEPHLKEGAGGLMDFQAGRWVIRAKYKTDRWDSVLYPDHSRMLDRSLQFLWTLRTQLHLLSGRKQDVLTFELQERVAPILGFSQGSEGVEAMMRQVHLSTQRILSYALGILGRARSEPSFVGRIVSSLKRGRTDHPFAVRGREVTVLDVTSFKRDPSQWMALFEYCQRTGLEPDYRTEEAVMEALPFLDERFRQSESVHHSFLSILRKTDRAGAILRKMHELGVLSRYLPEFSEIEGKVHYDLYHVHPVDTHSILAVEELQKLRDGRYREDYPLLTSLIHEVQEPEVLLLTALLHDIGKAGKGDHSLTGAALARGIATRLGLPAHESEQVHFLVKHHLLMSEIALRRDLHDEQAILNFASHVEDLGQLRMLYLLTFADIKAVGPEAWTSWKDSLLMELFLKTVHLLERQEAGEKMARGERILKTLRGQVPQDVLSPYSECLPLHYLSSYPAEDIADHLRMATGLEKQGLLVSWESKDSRRARVTVCTRDAYGLFSKIAGCMFLHRLNILEAQIHTWANGIVLDTFQVEDGTGDIQSRLQHFGETLEEVLGSETSLEKLLLKREDPASSFQKIVPRVPASIRINNQDSDFYTIIELTAEDRLGILYEMAHALMNHQCDIHFARISTYGNRAVDVFYVQDILGQKIEETGKLHALTETLSHLLSPRGNS